MTTTTTPDADLRYPVGRSILTKEPLTAARRRELVDQIRDTPREMRRVVTGLSPTQLDTPYRPGGWTVRQVAHHLPDSHMNAYIRFKLALTEEEPAIKPYDEAAWAELADTRTVAIESALVLLERLHERWVALLSAMGEGEFRRTLRHPERGVMTLDQMLELYAWHGRHHVAHIEGLRRRSSW